VRRSGLVITAMLGCTPEAAVAQVDTPGPRYGHEMVYDEARGVTLLFGGFGPDGVPMGDTWLWDGTAWHLASSAGPSPRKWPAAAYDSRRQVVVLHGGREGEGRSGPSLSDTWVWDGRDWSEVQVEVPTKRDHHRAVYDRARDRVVLFGGWDGERVVNDTWEWDGTNWSKAASEGPSPRAPFGMVYDQEREAVILAGGQDLERAYSDMWTWDGSRWSRLDAEVPGARGFHAMTYAPDMGGLLLFGGRNGDVLLNDLWSWSGEGWTLRSSGGPVLRGVYASAFDRRRGQLLIHGSGHLVNGEWRLDPRTWVWTVESGWRVVAGEYPE
jgi:hypothetical protein